MTVVDLGERGRFYAIPADVLDPPVCDVCGHGFTPVEWGERCWFGPELVPVHALCCPQCNQEER